MTPKELKDSIIRFLGKSFVLSARLQRLLEDYPLMDTSKDDPERELMAVPALLDSLLHGQKFLTTSLGKNLSPNRASKLFRDYRTTYGKITKNTFSAIRWIRDWEMPRGEAASIVRQIEARWRISRSKLISFVSRWRSGTNPVQLQSPPWWGSEDLHQK